MTDINNTAELNKLSANICLLYSQLVDHIYQQLMEKALAAGHQGLKLSHALILPQISAEGSRIIDIAKSQGVSKQAIGQIANELEELNYIERTPDPDDKRSKKLTLTSQGILLIKQAASFMNEVDRELQNNVGEALFSNIQSGTYQLFKLLSLKFPDAGQFTPEINKELPLIVYATSVATQLDISLKTENAKKGHQPLKRSYWHILEKITQPGVRINELAEAQGISKQAISQLAVEIEKAGYIHRENDPKDKRAKHLILTEKGHDLITSTLESTNTVENSVIEKIGEPAFIELKNALKQCLKNKDIHKESPPSKNTSAAIEKTLLRFLNQLQADEKALILEKDSDGNLRVKPKALKMLGALRI